MKIAIDPGHGQDNATPGLYDSGAVGKLDGHKYEEATIALAYGLKLRDKLEESGHKVFMTRDDASDSTPRGLRAQRAKDAGCEMFISLHLNSFKESSANGVEVQYRSTTKDKPLADALLAKLLAVTKLGDHHNDQRLDLAVLKFTPGPAVLIELGFITNEKDLRTLLDEKMQGRIVEAIAEVVTGKKAAASQGPAKPVAVTSPGKTKGTEAFAELGKLYANTPIAFPKLKAVTFAQWALESGWGTSGLAQVHNNFAGLKWRSPDMAGFATPVEYEAHDGKQKYCAFTGLPAFIAGFWHFMARTPYKGLEKHAESAEDYLDHILPNYTPDPGYKEEVLEVMKRSTELLKEDPAFVPPALPGPVPDVVPAPVNSAIIDRIVAIATAEWEFFGRQELDRDQDTVRKGHKEGEAAKWWNRIGDYWEVAGMSAWDGRTNKPWSAAFISWVMKQAGAGAHFLYSAAHWRYIRKSIFDHMDGETDAAFWGYDINNEVPRVGDLICYEREEETIVTYKNQPEGYLSHCDIVVEVRADEIFVIGGNVGNSVTKKALAIDENGYLDDHHYSWFAMMKNRLPLVLA